MLVLAAQADVARDGPFGKLRGKDMGHQLLLEVLGHPILAVKIHYLSRRHIDYISR